MPRIIYDAETNGLFADSIRPGTKDLSVITRVHCWVTQDADSGEVGRYHDDPSLPREGSLEDGARRILSADLRAGFNSDAYDERVLREFHPAAWASRNPAARVCDIMVGLNVVFPDEHLSSLDYARIKLPGSTFPPQLAGRQSLESWGHRIGMHKGKCNGGWAEFSGDMLTYCVQDVAVTAELFRRLERRIKGGTLSWRAWNLEQRAKKVIERQQVNGFAFDKSAAEALERRLMEERAELHDLLVTQFPPKEVYKVSPVRKKRSVRMVPFNPNSDMQVAERLQGLGWVPTEWTKGAKRKDGKGLKPRPKLTDDVLEHLALPGADLLLKFARITKRLEQLSTGDAAWLKHVREDGRIHGRVKHNGAVTGRATHSAPPIVGVPKVGKYLGRECRSLFTAGPGRLLVDVDAKGLEPRALAHYLHPIDGGRFVKEVVAGTLYDLAQKLFGIPDGPLARDTAKRSFLAMLYGAGDAKLARTAGAPREKGKAIRARFLKETRLGTLMRDIASQVARTGAVQMPDGRCVWVRSQHAALNSLLQGTGAVVAKVAAVRMSDRIEELGLDALQVHFAHDELVYDCAAGDAEAVKAEALAAVAWAGERLELRCPMAGDAHIGKNWAEVHG